MRCITVFRNVIAIGSIVALTQITASSTHGVTCPCKIYDVSLLRVLLKNFSERWILVNSNSTLIVCCSPLTCLSIGFWSFEEPSSTTDDTSFNEEVFECCFVHKDHRSLKSGAIVSCGYVMKCQMRVVTSFHDSVEHSGGCCIRHSWCVGKDVRMC